ncbi:hypothetical protein PRZ48_005866 [Zasmidium cellare]|uniref:Uncharacterized protein n=1 Tax=Zasmidium cellare TaxID=395010 RepID=A0ABR0ELI6_ZASCE|nr:hypothetical protein PRZ48_005866 [Zasmidium cellare]
MLSMPLALQYLHIGEAREAVGCQHEWEDSRWWLDSRADIYDRLCQRNVRRVLIALKQQASTLRFLGYSAGMERHKYEVNANLARLLEDPSANFASFTNLTEILCDEYSAFDPLLFDKRFPAPPHLRILTNFIPPHAAWRTPLDNFRPVQSLADKGITLRQFNLFVTEDYILNRASAGKRMIDGIARDFKEKEARMRVWTYRAHTWYPPYLFGQMRMQQKLRLDTDIPDNNGWLHKGDWQLCSEDFY